MKTHKGTAKRFKLTGSGKLMRTRNEKRHLRRKRSARSKRAAWTMVEVTPVAERVRITRLAPYLKKLS
ncbi:MAG: 50S ribosomal protein L35 [Chloroflexi bacterium]|nr:50S ribosomal protein L35 [Chloroflexota bacterium]